MKTILHEKCSFYSAPQVIAYLQRIDFPVCDYQERPLFSPNLANLEQLVRLHLIAFPFENTRLH